ncbi:MAG: helix-turn-helix domain-containing protein [Brotaphodocola sp.]
MELAEKIRKIREQTGLSRKDFSIHIGIPLRTIEDWEAGRRRPPEYIPRLIEYQIKYEELIGKKQREKQDAEK